MDNLVSKLNIVSENKFYFGGAVISTSLLFYIFRRYFSKKSFPLCKSKTRLDGKTVIITGCNTGIGKETALDLAKRNARVIMACRDIKKANEAAIEIRKLSGNGNVVVECLDLESLESVRNFTDRINSQEKRLDILINNAGVMICPQWKTKDGFEMQFGVNHIGHFLLTNLLLDLLKKSEPSRIVNVSSLAYASGRMHFDDINLERNYNPIVAYQQSKLCNVLFTRELAKKLKNSKVTVNCLHPGVIFTELSRHLMKTLGFFTYLLFYFKYKPIAKTIPQGAATSIYCAVSEDLEGVSGKYFSDCKETQLLPHALNDDDAKRLWEISEKYTKLN